MPHAVSAGNNVKSKSAGNKSGQDKAKTSCSKCVICLEAMTVGKSVRTHCEHTYHTTCFRSWAAQQQANGASVTCPLCRSVVPYFDEGLNIRYDPFKTIMRQVCDGTIIHHMTATEVRNFLAHDAAVPVGYGHLGVVFAPRIAEFP